MMLPILISLELILETLEKKKKDKNFTTMIEAACDLDKPVRIGVNWGQFRPELLADKLDLNNKSKKPKSLDDVMCDAVITSAFVQI